MSGRPERVGITRLRRAALDLQFSASEVISAIERLGLRSKRKGANKREWSRLYDAIQNANAGMHAVAERALDTLDATTVKSTIALCTHCFGTGKVVMSFLGEPDDLIEEACPACGGTGEE